MPRVFVLLPPVVGSVALVVTAFGGMTQRCSRLRPVPVIHARGATSAVIYFDTDDSSPGTGALAALHPIALRARSKPNARIVVQAYANERHDLQGNLDLAQRRARSIVRQLQAWSVTDGQITYAAAESGPTDEKGARCEVELIESVSAAETSTGLPEVSRALFEFLLASQATSLNRSDA